jgi:hypothetical protein
LVMDKGIGDKLEDTDVHYEREPVRHAAPYAAALEVFPPAQGEGTFSATPLHIEVSLGAQEFRGENGLGFELRFRRVILELIVERCEVARSGRYERTLPPEDYSHFLKRVAETSRLGEAQGSLGVTSLLNRILGNFGVEAGAQSSVAAKLLSEQRSEIESRLSVKMVRWVGAGRWEIGHEIVGDPNEIDGLLKGAYLASPGDGRSKDESNPLCKLNPIGEDDYRVCIELRARKIDCDYRLLGGKLSGPIWGRINRNKIEKILALKMLEEANRAEGLIAPEGEVVLARASLEAKRKIESGSDEN